MKDNNDINGGKIEGDRLSEISSNPKESGVPLKKERRKKLGLVIMKYHFADVPLKRKRSKKSGLVIIEYHFTHYLTITAD